MSPLVMGDAERDETCFTPRPGFLPHVASCLSPTSCPCSRADGPSREPRTHVFLPRIRPSRPSTSVTTKFPKPSAVAFRSCRIPKIFCVGAFLYVSHRIHLELYNLHRDNLHTIFKCIHSANTHCGNATHLEEGVVAKSKGSAGSPLGSRPLHHAGLEHLE